MIRNPSVQPTSGTAARRSTDPAPRRTPGPHIEYATNLSRHLFDPPSTRTCDGSFRQATDSVRSRGGRV